MNGNNSWQQRTGQFARFPRHDLSSVSQPPAGELFPVGQLMEGGGIPAPAMMPQQPMPRQQIPQQYGQRQPTGKKILGMPKDRFIALMGTIARAMAPETAAGRMGEGLVSMADMMRGERMAQGERQATEAEARRKTAAQTAKEKRAAATKKKGKVPTVRTFRVGDMDVQHSFNYDTRKWEPIPGMKGKKVKEVEEKKKAPTIRTFRIGDKDVQHAWDTDTGKWKSIPGMPGKKVAPPAGEKPPTRTELRAQRKEVRGLEATARGVDPKTGKANIEYPESQISVDEFNELSDKSYVLRRVPGIPKEEKSFMGIDVLRPDVPAVPATLEEIPISQFKTPEDVLSADYLTDKAQRRLLLKLFPKKFE